MNNLHTYVHFLQPQRYRKAKNLIVMHNGGVCAAKQKHLVRVPVASQKNAHQRLLHLRHPSFGRGYQGFWISCSYTCRENGPFRVTKQAAIVNHGGKAHNRKRMSDGRNKKNRSKQRGNKTHPLIEFNVNQVPWPKLIRSVDLMTAGR